MNSVRFCRRCKSFNLFLSRVILIVALLRTMILPCLRNTPFPLFEIGCRSGWSGTFPCSVWLVAVLFHAPTVSSGTFPCSFWLVAVLTSTLFHTVALASFSQSAVVLFFKYRISRFSSNLSVQGHSRVMQIHTYPFLCSLCWSKNVQHNGTFAAISTSTLRSDSIKMVFTLVCCLTI